MDQGNEERAYEPIVEKIKAIELDAKKHYIIFIPMSTRLSLEAINWMQADLEEQGYGNIMFVQVKSTEGIRVTENAGRNKTTNSPRPKAKTE